MQVSLDELGSVAGLDASPKAAERARSAPGDLPESPRRGASEPAGAPADTLPSPVAHDGPFGEGDAAAPAVGPATAWSGDALVEPTPREPSGSPSTAAREACAPGRSPAMAGAPGGGAPGGAASAVDSPREAAVGKDVKETSPGVPTSPRIDLTCEGRCAQEGRAFAVEEMASEASREGCGKGAQSADVYTDVGLRAECGAPTSIVAIEQRRPSSESATPTAGRVEPSIQDAAPGGRRSARNAGPGAAPSDPVPAATVDYGPSMVDASSELGRPAPEASGTSAAELDAVRATLASSSLGAGPFASGAAFPGGKCPPGKIDASALDTAGVDEADTELSISETSDLPAGSELSVPTTSGLVAAITPEAVTGGGPRSSVDELPPGVAATPPDSSGEGSAGRKRVDERPPAASGEVDVKAAKESAQRDGPPVATVAASTATAIASLSTATPDASQAAPAWMGLSSPAESGTTSQVSASPATLVRPKPPPSPNLDRPPTGRDAAGGAPGVPSKQETPDRTPAPARTPPDGRGRRSRPPSTLSRPASGAATPGGDGRTPECGQDDWGSSSDGEAIFQDVAMGGMEMDGLATLGARLAPNGASVGLVAPGPAPLSAPVAAPTVDGGAPSIPLFSNFAARPHGSLGALSSEALDSAHSSPGHDSALLLPVPPLQTIRAEEPPAPARIGVGASRRVAAVEVPPTPRLRGGSPFGSSPFAHSSPMMEQSLRPEPPRPPSLARRSRDPSAAPLSDSLQSARTGRLGPVPSAGAPSSLRGSYRVGGIARPPCPPGPAAISSAGQGVSLPITLATTEVPSVSRAPIAPLSSRSGRHAAMSSSLPSNYEDARLALKLDIISGPSADRSYTTEEETVEVCARPHRIYLARICCSAMPPCCPFFLPPECRSAPAARRS